MEKDPTLVRNLLVLIDVQNGFAPPPRAPQITHLREMAERANRLPDWQVVHVVLGLFHERPCVATDPAEMTRLADATQMYLRPQPGDAVLLKWTDSAFEPDAPDTALLRDYIGRFTMVRRAFNGGYYRRACAGRTTIDQAALLPQARHTFMADASCPAHSLDPISQLPHKGNVHLGWIADAQEALAVSEEALAEQTRAAMQVSGHAGCFHRMPRAG